VQPINDVPVILLYLKYGYVNRRKKSSTGLPESLACNKRSVELTAQQGYKFNADPPPKQTCFLMLYVDPQSCKTWENGVLGAGSLESFNALKIFPATFFYPFIYPVVPYRSVRLYKSGVYICQVEKAKDKELRIQQSYFFTISHIIDQLWKHWMFDGTFTKFIIGIKYSKQLENYSTKYTYLRTATDIGALHSKIDQECPAILNPFINFLCFGSRRFFKWLNDTNIIDFEIDKENINSRSLKTSYFKKGTSVTILNVYDDWSFTLPNPAYFLDFTHGDQDIKQVFLQSLCKNCTITSKKELIYFHIFPMLTLQELPYISTDLHFAPNSEPFHFVTCFPTEQPGWFSLVGYVSAFDLETWLMLLVSAASSGFVMSRVFSHSNWDDYSFVYMILLGQGTNGIQKLKWISGAWILAGEVLTFFYQGDNINKLIAPLEPERLDSFIR